VTKPIKPKILVSKVKGLLRRYKEESKLKSALSFSNLLIDRERYKVFIAGEERSLPKKEFELLYLLASNPGKVFNRDKIMEKVWGTSVVVGDRTIDVHIRKLREKLGESFFKTIKGVGYTFISPEN
jgi:two-component system alkaline phosphatase synthesis response regulator PhoP